MSPLEAMTKWINESILQFQKARWRIDANNSRGNVDLHANVPRHGYQHFMASGIRDNQYLDSAGMHDFLNDANQLPGHGLDPTTGQLPFVKMVCG